MSDRKYRHRGYQDSGSSSSGGEGRSRPFTPSEPRRERVEGAPRGRSAGAPGPEVFKCAGCGEVQRGFGSLGPASVCTRCGSELHTCSNCRNFDTSTRWECREEIPARVSPKDRRNECTFFAPKIVRDLNADKVKIETPDDARKAFENLFKK